MTETPAARSVGRPRRTGVAGADPRREILQAASRLFAERGYAQTTMTQVAREVGLGQSSLYYWFRSKEDLLKALVSANRESLDVAERLAAGDASPAVRLYAVLHADVLQMCGGALDFYDLERAAGSQPDVFAEVLANYGRLRQALEDIVVAGVEAGELVAADARLAVLACLAQTEGVQHRFRVPTPDETGRPAALATAQDAARLAATTAVRALLADPSALEEVQRLALRELED